MSSSDLLFISYATEDIPFSDWLALKLTGLGYKVWYDRMTLLAGQSFVKEVDEAISNKSFRVLALLSKNSVNKENPSNERTKAIAVGKAKKIDNFLITLNVDGLTSSEIPWTLSEKSYVAFHSDWAEGLKQLLKTLEAIDAPRNIEIGSQLVRQWFSAKDTPELRSERIWTNMIPINSVPTVLRRYENITNKDLRDCESVWTFAIENRDFVWAFEEPPVSLKNDFTLSSSVSWNDISGEPGTVLQNRVKFLFSKSFEKYCLMRGLVFANDRRTLYFPKELLPADKVQFIGLYGKKTYFKVIGERTFRVGGAMTEVNRHHLSPRFKLIRADDGKYYFQLTNRLFITNADGTPIHPTRMNRRRKKICKNWWNDKWGSRLLGVMSWLADSKEEISIFQTRYGNFTLAGKAISLSCNVGINESGGAVDQEEKDASEGVIDDHEAMDVIGDYSNDGGGGDDEG